jgi:phage gp46-like protein
MPDIAIAWDPQKFRGEWVLSGGDLAVGSDLEAAVMISLFSDRVASPDFIPPDGTGNRRGWWADSYEPSPLGSRLWQLARAVKSDRTTILNQARDYCREALQWLVDDGVIAQVAVITSWITATTLGIQVTVTPPSGNPLNYRFQWAWKGI